MPRKSGILNFVPICNKLKRQPQQVMLFFLSELNTDGSIAENQLIVKYRLTTNQAETLFRKYIKNYVKCELCKSTNTILERDKQNRL